ncbi:unnamed protein product [Brassicogethes aeneus]|uniref:Uncharacterized protein n=1 Tax=Brassicogethes aeneus TaxID=1431903 RepID=A0A9P0FDJ8_BRAAE|nr:unnamed protein product [Brassicogethes aeneus]
MELKFNRTACIACTSGLLFFFGWWLFIDVTVQYGKVMKENGVYFLPGILGTISGILMNLIPLDALTGSILYGTTRCGIKSSTAARLLLLFCLMILFGSIIAAIYILISDFGLNQSRPQYPGYGIFIQNISIFSAAMIIRFTKREDNLI